MTPEIVAPEAWRAIDFISDLHLAEHAPRVFEAWAHHLRSTSADAVFILGDLFEVWVGDDAAEHGFEARCVDVLTGAAARRTIAFMPGNRDFLVGDALLEQSGIVRLADPTVIAAFDSRIVVSHGDVLCSDDVAYQRYRSVVRRPTLQRAFKALPLTMRSAIARRVREKSQARGKTASPLRYDVDETAALGWLRAHDASAIVHGHTHAPESHAMATGLDRHVLTDWDLDAEPPRAEVLRWTASGFQRIAPEALAAT